MGDQVDTASLKKVSDIRSMFEKGAAPNAPDPGKAKEPPPKPKLISGIPLVQPPKEKESDPPKPATTPTGTAKVAAAAEVFEAQGTAESSEIRGNDRKWKVGGKDSAAEEGGTPAGKGGVDGGRKWKVGGKDSAAEEGGTPAGKGGVDGGRKEKEGGGSSQSPSSRAQPGAGSAAIKNLAAQLEGKINFGGGGARPPGDGGGGRGEPGVPLSDPSQSEAPHKVALLGFEQSDLFRRKQKERLDGEGNGVQKDGQKNLVGMGLVENALQKSESDPDSSKGKGWEGSATGEGEGGGGESVQEGEAGSEKGEGKSGASRIVQVQMAKAGVGTGRTSGAADLVDDPDISF
uniref:Uncharacterized protein n=1 Tax=Chromera velia CCMP2878 TaxID=1169474 RepID=A0A0G4FG75_9ALVE|eukprot:Cvel_16676.t1-p1 / transcript=Cvel_16676.t1 / gene=Cvel_16676 / organism=Chromera_velia_CCMP2878 / gene_product=hypothetical protein / transcript_product=hypothetical protein / location=Cvel_scaffold1294:37606-41144(+) / protein_length=345 / sequence_SO=supercontig / SO=protein_coding / is_pseudo=false